MDSKLLGKLDQAQDATGFDAGQGTAVGDVVGDLRLEQAKAIDGLGCLLFAQADVFEVAGLAFQHGLGGVEEPLFVQALPLKFLQQRLAAAEGFAQAGDLLPSLWLWVWSGWRLEFSRKLCLRGRLWL